jgi:hypothetical protein
MRTVITAQGFDLSEKLRESVRREIERFIQSTAKPVNIVSVHLVDDRAHAMRGREKLCQVRVGFSDEDRELVEADAEARFDASVTEAFLKIMRAVPRLRYNATRHLAKAS